MELNGWEIFSDGRYLYICRNSSAGMVQIKAEDEGLVVDLYDDNEEPNCVGTAAATWRELERE